MYRHLLVPLDATPLSIQVVGNAVGLARSLGARLTFFHALSDHTRSLRGEMDVLRLTASDDYDYAATGKTRELLSKAEAAARALGVPCESFWMVSDRPAKAITEAAHSQGCDLIFMASHGHHGKLGMALASDTISVLMTAGLPVLVSAVGEPKSPARAIGIIRDEHRSLAAALHAWLRLLAEARVRRATPDVTVMAAIVHYLRDFPTALHHPKEERHLFARLRQRTRTVDAELDELQLQHTRDHALVDELDHAVQAVAQAPDTSAALAAALALEQAVARYADFHWEHMGREEAVILPAAQAHLLEEDWLAIDAAFSQDPDLGLGGQTDHEYHQLIARIVSMAEQGAGPVAR